MSANSFQVTNPTLPKEDKPNTTLIKMLIILAIVGGLGWFIYKKVEDGSFDEIKSQIEEAIKEAEEESNNSAITAIEKYLNGKYDDDCTYSSAALVKLPEDANGGLFTCKKISDMKVFAYAIEEDDDEYTFEDGYLYAKHFWMTETSFKNTVKLYFPSAKTSLINSNYGISTTIDQDTPFPTFVKNNGFKYAARVNLRRGTGISINNLTDLANHLTMSFPNYQLDGIYMDDIDADPASSTDSDHVFTIKCENGKASISVNQ